MKAKELQDLIDFIAKSGLDEVNIETEEFKIKVRKTAEQKTRIIETSAVAAQPVIPAQTVAPVAAPTNNIAKEETPAAASDNSSDAGSDKYITIKSPMIGTFYRSANPESDSFVNVGDKVGTGQTVCIVEAMKLFNEIESEVSGTIVKILVENASPVEYDQPLFLVDPS